MTKGISEVTDERGVTHHVRGEVRFVHLPKGRQRRNPARQGYYVTKSGCGWWCTGQLITANSRATPGKAVDCMTCLVNPPERPQPRRYENLLTDRISSRTARMLMASAPSGRETSIFDVKTRATRSITTGRRTGRRR